LIFGKEVVLSTHLKEFNALFSNRSFTDNDKLEELFLFLFFDLLKINTENAELSINICNNFVDKQFFIDNLQELVFEKFRFDKLHISTTLSSVLY
jgi:hypothetical protein